MDTAIHTTKVGTRTLTVFRCKGFNPDKKKFKCKEAYYIRVTPTPSLDFSNYLWNNGTVHPTASGGQFEGWYATIKDAKAAITKFRKRDKVKT